MRSGWMRAVAATAVAGLALSLAACTGSRELTTTVVWPEGQAPAGPLDDDPAVQAVRAFELVYAAAWNAADFTGEQVRAVMPESIAAHGAETLAERLERDAAEPMPSPNGVVPLEVFELESSEAGAVAVLACATHVVSPFVGAIGGTYRVTKRWYELEPHDAGLRVVSNSPQGDVGPGADVNCDDVEVPLALFDPAPNPAEWEKLTPADVRGP